MWLPAWLPPIRPRMTAFHPKPAIRASGEVWIESLALKRLRGGEEPAAARLRVLLWIEPQWSELSGQQPAVVTCL